MPIDRWRTLSRDIVEALSLEVPPIAISFVGDADGIPPLEEPIPPAVEDGRTGRVPAGCVFWIKAVDRTFSTTRPDHANCSVGSLTHGFVTLDEVAGNDDVAALLESQWISSDEVPDIPAVTDNPGTIVYGPLEDAAIDPDVTLLRISAAQLMALSDAIPDLHIGGKPQCHIIALAKQRGAIAASTGCALSRVRTGMPDSQMTIAIPGARVQEVVDRLRATTRADAAVASYARRDSARFGAR